MRSTSPASTHRAALKIVLVLISTVVSFTAGEVFMRLLGYHGETVTKVENTILVDDPVINWRYMPNSESYFNNIVYRYNERGFRDRIYPYQKAPDTFRIFLASDSVGLGTNVQVEESYPKILERNLNALNLPFHVEVISHSMSGMSLKQKLHLVELYALPYNPDLIILDYVVNDVEFESRKNPEKEKTQKCAIELIHLRFPCSWKGFLKSSALLYAMKEGIENSLHRMNWEDRNHFYDQVESDYYHRLYAEPQTGEYLTRLFSQIRKYQEEKGIRVVMPIFPLIYDYDKYKWDDINERIIKLCKENDLQYISLLGDFKKYNYNEMRVQRGDFSHPSVKGNAIAADAILRSLLERKLVKLHSSENVGDRGNVVQETNKQGS